jgi:hypothetical protein
MAADVAISRSFGPNAISSFTVWTEEVAPVEGPRVASRPNSQRGCHHHREGLKVCGLRWREMDSNFRFRERYKRGLGPKSSLRLHAAVDYLRLPLLAIS